MENHLCTVVSATEENVKNIKKNTPVDYEIDKLADFIKVFSDRTRLRILYCLMETELCVCDIACILEMSHSSISHQLRVLKQARLVRNEKRGKEVFYSIHDAHVKEIILVAYTHIKEV